MLTECVQMNIRIDIFFVWSMLAAALLLYLAKNIFNKAKSSCGPDRLTQTFAWASKTQ